VGIFGAQLIGANKQQRLNELLKNAIALNYIIGLTLTGLAYLFSKPILSLFLTDPTTLATAQTSLYITLWSFIILGHSIILSGLMRSSGTVLWPTALTTLSVILVEMPSAYILSHTIGLHGVWLAYPLSFITSLIALYVYYHFFWKNKKHTRFFEKPEKQPS
jgi:Na+-driven multidrug efflux pump